MTPGISAIIQISY